MQNKICWNGSFRQSIQIRYGSAILHTSRSKATGSVSVSFWIYTPARLSAGGYQSIWVHIWSPQPSKPLIRSEGDRRTWPFTVTGVASMFQKRWPVCFNSTVYSNLSLQRPGHWITPWLRLSFPPSNGRRLTEKTTPPNNIFVGAWRSIFGSTMRCAPTRRWTTRRRRLLRTHTSLLYRKVVSK